jgi:hypothetical protein
MALSCFFFNSQIEFDISNMGISAIQTHAEGKEYADRMKQKGALINLWNQGGITRT